MSSKARFMLSGLIVAIGLTMLVGHNNAQWIKGFLERLASDPIDCDESRVYWNSTSKQAKVCNGTAWTALGSGGGGSEKNYINPDHDAETGTVGAWATYADAAATTPADGTGGTATTTFGTTAVTTEVIAGSNSYELAKPASNEQGEGVSYDFTLDRADTNKPLKINVKYQTSANYTSSDVVVYIYDVTNTTLITPSQTEMAATSGAIGHFIASWASTDSTSYRVIFHIAGTGTTAWDLFLDEIVVGPGVRAQGAVVTGWKSYTPTTQGFGTVSGVAVEYAEVGETLHVKGKFTTGTVTASEAQVGLPNDYTALVPASPLQIGTAARGATGSRDLVVLATTDDAFVNFGWTSQDTEGSGGNPLTVRNGNDLTGNSETFTFEFSVRVNELVGRGVLNIGENDVEYAFNTDTDNDDDTTSFGYGPQGVNFGAYDTATRSKRVKFQSPIQPTDEITIETSRDGLNWVTAGDDYYVEMRTREGSTEYGIDYTPVDSTSIDVNFHPFRNKGTGVYGASGNAWSSIALFFWRVKKTRAGAAVGFGAATSTQAGLVKQDSGIYTPTFASHTNLDNTQMGDPVGYSVVGNVVELFGIFRVEATSAGIFSFTMTYPPGLSPRGSDNPSTPGTSANSFGHIVTRENNGFGRIVGNASFMTINGNSDTTAAEFFTFSVKYFTD